MTSLSSPFRYLLEVLLVKTSSVATCAIKARRLRGDFGKAANSLFFAFPNDCRVANTGFEGEGCSFGLFDVPV